MQKTIKKKEVNYRPKIDMKCATCKNCEWKGFELYCKYILEDVYCECVCDKWENKNE